MRASNSWQRIQLDILHIYKTTIWVIYLDLKEGNNAKRPVDIRLDSLTCQDSTNITYTNILVVT